ncbi:MAG: sulfatase [Jejuia sp.]
MRFLLFYVLFLAFLSLEAQEKPNIIWIFTDDHSYQTIGAYGGILQSLNPTPNIDKLASEGMIFNKCYVENSICAPSRATLLTGKMSHMHGKYNNKQSVVFDHNQPQFQKVLQTNGYQTAMIGKIHLDGNMQGFDYWDVLIRQGEYKNPNFLSENGVEKTNGYVTDIVTDKALYWLGEERDQNKPFMLMIHQKAPHRPWVPKREFMNLYEDVAIPEPENLFDDYKTKTTAVKEQDMTISETMLMDSDLKLKRLSQRKERYEKIGLDDRFNSRKEKYKNLNLSGRELVKFKYQMYMKDYLRCIKSVDDNIGRVLKYLEETGLAKNTIVMYSSDQGFYMGEHGWFDKRFMYEESFRTPLIVKWPGVTKPGSLNSDLVQNIDFAETFLEMAEAPIPKDMQGESLVPLLRGKTPRAWRKNLYYHYYEYPGPHSVRRHEGMANKRYKLIRFYGEDVPNGEEWEFYDLQNDPSEMNNLYPSLKNKSRVLKMKQDLIKLKRHYQVL